MVTKADLEKLSILAPNKPDEKVYQHLSSRILKQSPRALEMKGPLLSPSQARMKKEMYVGGDEIEKMLEVMAGHSKPSRLDKNSVGRSSG